jgi:Tol biopolymer transport system component
MQSALLLRPISARTAVCGIVSFLATAALSLAQTTTRVSTTPINSQANYHSFYGAVSDDGLFVAFQSNASNLVLSDLNFHVPDIFMKDRTTSNTALVSVDSANMQGNSGSMAPSISSSGRYTAFESLASNLVAGDANGVWDVFVRDAVNGTTVRVSVSSGGVEGDADSRLAAISADGRYVAFESLASNLVPGDTNGVSDVFVHDTTTGTTTLVSADASGVPGNAASSWASISADGRFVAFESAATNLVASDTNGAVDVFVKDMLTGALARVSVDTTGAEANGASDDPSISPDGHCVAFESLASNLVPADGNGMTDVFVRDLTSGVTTRVSTSSTGVEGNSQSLVVGNHHLSFDGRYVAFESVASNLVAGDTNGTSDVFVHDRITGATERVSVTTSGVQGNSNSRGPSISADGRFIVFESSANNLVLGDNNLMWDVFLRDRGVDPSVSFCFGDGSGTACPCANNGTAGNGCANSLNPSGARLTGSGNPSLASDGFVLSGTGMPSSSALYFQGTATLGGGAGAVFGDGLRCAGGTITRLATKLNASGASRYPDVGDVPISIRGLVTAGLRTYQLWYRNAAAYCTASTFNLTNGVSVTWTP